MGSLVGRLVVVAALVLCVPAGGQAQGVARAGLSQPATQRPLPIPPTELGAKAATWGRQKVTTVVGGVLGAVAGYFIWRSVAGPDAFPDVRVLVITAAIGAFVGHVFGAQGPSTGNALRQHQRS